MNSTGMAELLLVGMGGKQGKMGMGRKKRAPFLVDRISSASSVKRDVWSQPGCVGRLQGRGGSKAGRQRRACSVSPALCGKTGLRPQQEGKVQELLHEG